MRRRKIPLVVLGGSDRRPGAMPGAGAGVHPLCGYKGIEIRIDGRPLVEVLVQRVEACGGFGPIYLAGPSRLYAHLPVQAALIETDGSFGHNIRASIEAVREGNPGSPMAFITCDVLPEPSTLAALLENYRHCAPCDIWFPMIRVPENRERLGASAWKPSYRVVPGAGERPIEVLGGHLVIVDVQALRVEFLCRLFDLAYRTRNRSVDQRRRVIVRSLLRGLIREDLRNLAKLRWPTFAWNVLNAGLRAAGALRDGTITRERLEWAVGRILVHDRGRTPRVCTPILQGLSLALDIDTVEEAHAVGAEISA